VLSEYSGGREGAQHTIKSLRVGFGRRRKVGAGLCSVLQQVGYSEGRDNMDRLRYPVAGG
jgi:hypothetical protein